MVIGIASGLIVAAIVALFGWIWKAPRLWIAEFIQAGLNRPRSELHAVVTGRFPPTWSRVDTPDGPQVGWQCELRVTNGGNRVDSPVRGELEWRGRRTTFTTPMSDGQGRPLPFLEPEWSGLLRLNAWTPIRDGEDPQGDQATEVVLFDRHEGSHPAAVTFSPVPKPVVTPGQCGSSSVRGPRTLICDRPVGHDDGHSVRDPATGVVSTWDESGPGPDFAVW